MIKNRRKLISYPARIAYVALSLAGFAGSAVAGGERSGEVLSETRQQELKYLMQQDCGSCHGLRLKGGLGPPLLPQALAGKPHEYLKQVITYGSPGSAMPPWGKLLSQQEIEYLVYLLTPESGFAQEVNP